MPLHRCKFCRHDYPSYRELRRHSEEEHPQEFARVSQWLGKSVQPRLEQFEKVASEGLIGHREQHDD